MVMSRDTDADWSKIAKENPYWGVLSHDDYLGTDLEQSLKERFLLSGQNYFKNLLGFIHHHIQPDFKIVRGLDFGCGVGRLLIPLAEHAERAVGVDVAPNMLELTRKHLSERGISNTDLVLGDDTLSRVTGTYNFVNSYIVLQHIPPERGMRLIRRMLQLLDVGGVFSLHLTYAKERKFFMHEQGRASYYRRSGNVIHDLDPAETETPEGTITMFDYDLNEVIAVISEVAGHPLLILPTNHGGHLGVQAIGIKARG